MIYPIPTIQSVTAAHFAMTVDQLCSRDRHQHVAMARHIAMYLMRLHTGASFPEIGRAFGNRDHSTVVSAVQKITTLKDLDAGVADAIVRIEKALMEGVAA